MFKKSDALAYLSAVALSSLFVGPLGSTSADAKAVKIVKCQGGFFAAKSCTAKTKKPKKPASFGNEGGGGGGAGGGGGSKSDIRLKDHIHLVGTTVLGLPLYDFSYIGQTGTYEGVMAQDVMRVMPEAVYMASDGYYRVKYNLLGIAMKRLD